MNNKDNPLYNKHVQDTLNKLISEEMIANLMYHTAVITVQLGDAAKIYEMFKSIAEDELFDHHRALTQFAYQNGYMIPVQEKEYKKFASETCWKLYDTMKKNQDAKYYVELAIKAEIDAIQSYDSILKSDKNDDIPYELFSIVQKNYYDEIEHLEDLKTLLSSLEANVELIWTNSDETTNILPNMYWW